MRIHHRELQGRDLLGLGRRLRSLGTWTLTPRRAGWAKVSRGKGAPASWSASGPVQLSRKVRLVRE